MRVAIYARKSSEDEGGSVERQLAEARDFAARRGWEVAAAYSDEAVSGADPRRLAGKARMLEGLGSFDAIVTRDSSRFSRRDGDEAFAEMKKIARAGVELWFYQDAAKFEHGDFGRNLVGFAKAEAAADYRRQIARW